MDKKGLKKLNKVLFAMLARQPDLYGLFPDKDGWIKIRDIHGALAQEPDLPHITMASLIQFFNILGSDRFETDGLSVQVKNWREELSGPETATPPEVLYLPIKPRAYEHIATNGFLPPPGSEWVILSVTRDMAIKIGKRRANEPLVSEVLALEAGRGGVEFKKFGENLFLAGALKPEWLRLPPLPKGKQKNKPKNEKNTARPRPKYADDKAAPRAPEDLANIGSYILNIRPDTSAQGSPSPTFDDKKKRKRFRDKEPEWKQTRHIKKRK